MRVDLRAAHVADGGASEQRGLQGQQLWSREDGRMSCDRAAFTEWSGREIVHEIVHEMVHDACEGKEVAAMTCCRTDWLDNSRVERGTTCSVAWAM